MIIGSFLSTEAAQSDVEAVKMWIPKIRGDLLWARVSDAGIRTDPETTKAIKNWSVQKNVKGVRACLGFSGYYRRFIKANAKIAWPLNDLLVGRCTSKTSRKKKKTTRQVPFIWTDIRKLMRPPVLAYAKYSKLFKLHTGASCIGLGPCRTKPRWHRSYRGIRQP